MSVTHLLHVEPSIDVIMSEHPLGEYRADVTQAAGLAMEEGGRSKQLSPNSIHRVADCDDERDRIVHAIYVRRTAAPHTDSDKESFASKTSRTHL